MTDAEQAYAVAERMIADAKATGAARLVFYKEETHALATLPPEIATLTALDYLDLDGTQISDLGPLSGLTSLTKLRLNRTQVSDVGLLSGLTSLTGLRLDGTQVSDLRPLRGLRDLADNPDFFGLTFKTCAATRIDAEIARISEIGDNSERARALFTYLEDWVPPGEVAAGEPDNLIPVDIRDDRLEVPASTPTEAERDEALKRALHERLREKSKALAVAAGNQFSRLSARARAVELQVEAEFAEVDLLMLHLAVDDLREMEGLGREDEESGDFPAEVLVPLRDVLRIGPGLTLGHPDVDTLVERANRRREGPDVPRDELAAQDALSRASREDDAAIGDNLRELQGVVIGSESAEDRVVQSAANRSMLWRIAVWGGKLTGAVAVGVTINAVSPSVITFVEVNWPVLKAAAATYGPQFYDWFVASVAQSKDFAGLVDKQAGRKRR